MVRKARKYTSPHVPTKKELKEAAEAGSRYLTEAEKDEIEAGPKPEKTIRRTMVKPNTKAKKVV